MHWIPVVVVVGETVSYNIAPPVFSVWENGTCPSLARDAGPTIGRLKRGFFLQKIVIQMGANRRVVHALTAFACVLNVISFLLIATDVITI
jgi:hypothetical protein